MKTLQKITNRIQVFFLTMFLSVIMPANAFADSGGDALFTVNNPLASTGDIYALIQAILSFIVKLGSIVVVFMIIYSGYLFVTARGNQGKIDTAKANFYYTVLGALILLGAQVLAQVVCNTANSLGAGVSCRTIF